jgi:hypothetical protein
MQAFRFLGEIQSDGKILLKGNLKELIGKRGEVIFILAEEKSILDLVSEIPDPDQMTIDEINRIVHTVKKETK